MEGCKGRGQPYGDEKGKAAGERQSCQIFLRAERIPEQTGGSDGKR